MEVRALDMRAAYLVGVEAFAAVVVVVAVVAVGFVGFAAEG